MKSSEGGRINTTLEFGAQEGDNYVHIDWYIPLHLVEPESDILLDDAVRGDTHGFPVDDDWEINSKNMPPTKASELGDEIADGAERIKEAVMGSDYPTTSMQEPYVVTVHTDTEIPYCTLITIVKIQ